MREGTSPQLCYKYLWCHLKFNFNDNIIKLKILESHNTQSHEDLEQNNY